MKVVQKLVWEKVEGEGKDARVYHFPVPANGASWGEVFNVTHEFLEEVMAQMRNINEKAAENAKQEEQKSD